MIGRNHPTLTGRNVLDRMKAEYRHVGNPAHFAAAVLSAESVAGIFDNDQSVMSPDFPNCIQVRGMSRIIHRQNRSRPWREPPFDLFGIEVESVDADVS